MTPPPARGVSEWHIITCEYPPSIGGVSDYAFTLASGLAATGPVQVWCPRGTGASPVAPNVTVHQELSSFSRRELQRLGNQLDSAPGPRRLFVQWVPQGFGYRSLNLGFALWVADRAWRRGDQVHLMVHEPFLPWSSNPIHAAVSVVHRIMLALASSGATRVWLSTSRWKDRIRHYVRPGIPVEWLPVPAPTLPDGSGQCGDMFEGAGLTVGHFGTHTSLVTSLLAPALDVILQQPHARILLVGQGSDAFRESFLRTRPHAATRVRATGVLETDSVAGHLRACDLMIQPYPDGVTTRRTSTLTLLSLGLPVVTNSGHLSEGLWKESGAVSLASAPDGPALGQAAVTLMADLAARATLATRARDLYDRQFASRHAVALLSATDPESMPPEQAPSDLGCMQPWLLISAAFVKTGGQDRANFALASFLARQGTQVHLVAHRISDDVGPPSNIVRHAVPRPLHSDLLGEPFLQWFGARWAFRLREQSPRVVANGGNCNWPDVNWVHYVHAAYDRTGDGSVLQRARMQVAHRRWLRDERRALHRARLVVANSNRTKRDLIDRVGVSPERIRVIYYGIDQQQFRPPVDGERSATRAELGWSEGRQVALFIGALGDRRKGFDTVYRAWQRLSRPGGSNPLLVVIGRGAMLPEWQRRVTAAGLDRAITFLGFREDVPRLVRAADILVAPTRYEAYGLGVHEALCCGLPAVVSADAGVAERYPAELLDLLLPDAENAEDLAQRIDRCLSNPADLAGPMRSFSAQLRARSWDDMARDIVRSVHES